MQLNLLLLEKQLVVTALLLLLTWLCSVDSEYAAVGTCNSADIDSRAREPCVPCAADKWFDLILEQRAGLANETNCFNDDPLGTQLPLPCPQSLTKGRDHPQLDLTKTPRGFIITKSPFFRYNTIPRISPRCGKLCPLDVCAVDADNTTNSSSSTTTPPPTTTSPVGNSSNITKPVDKGPPEDNLDIGNVEPYYNDTASSPINGHNVDFQLLEWPGRTHDAQTKFLEQKIKRECKEGTDFKSHKPYLCSLTDNTKPSHFQMLKYQRGSSKMLHYPCNQAEGTSIVALGLNAVFEESESDDHPHSKIYLSYNNISIFKSHAHPLYVSEHILNEMAKNEDDEPKGICRKYDPEEENCDFTETANASATDNEDLCYWRRKYFVERVRILLNKTACEAPFKSDPQCQNCRTVKKQLSGDLRTVLDFTFVQGRLILGMRCGILIISDFLNKILDIQPASLLSSRGKHKNTFHPINKLASSFCCKPTGCRRTIVAAYSSWQDRGVDTPKEIYISFDLGTTFQVKLIAEQISSLNLMWGLYKAYGNWILYHQLLESPDPEDLKDERGFELHPGYVGLRNVPDWDTLPLKAKEKRFLFGESASRSLDRNLIARKKALRRYLRLRTSGALGRFVRYRRQGKEIDLDLAPDWLKREVAEHRIGGLVPWKDQWTDSNCDSVAECRRNFKNDDAVKYFLKDSDVIVKTRKRHAHEEPFCDQIQSIAVLEEEDSLFLLCRVGFGDFSKPYEPSSGGPSSCASRDSDAERQDMPSCAYPLQNTSSLPSKEFKYNPCVNPTKFYAIFTVSVKEKHPLVVIEERRSERLFTCKPIKVDMDWDGCKSRYVSPELVRVPHSIVLLVKDCEDILYYSPNGGRTIFNTQFYAHRSQFAGVKNSHVSNNCSQIDDCHINLTSTSNERQLMYRIKALDVPPIISIHRQTNNVIFMTMRNMYAYGLLGINTEFKMIVGEIFPNIEENIISKIRSNDFVFPDFTFSGLAFFGVALKLVYSHNKLISCELYSSRHGMRLVAMDFFFFKDVSYYYNENQDFDSEARTSELGFSVCQTHSFAANPRRLALDAGEGGTVEVTTFDPHPNIPLGLVSSEEKSIIVDVSFVDRQRGEKDHLSHDWDVRVKALHNYKPRVTALVDSFFGVENNNMFGFYTEIGLANNVEFRCHVQPVATVSVQIECLGKKLVAHEDEHRPQCQKGTFSKSAFEYRLKKGSFDPHLAAYWMGLEEKEGTELIKIERDTGDLVIVYDYLRFGCPLEPYKDEAFIPELRIVTEEKKFNSSFGERYNGSYLIIELFGSSGFSFTETYEDYGCTYLPMDLKNATVDWVHRQRLFQVAQSRQKSFTTLAEIENATLDDLDELEYGNQLFYPDAVDHPINIVNRVTYRDCKQWRNFYLPSENKTFKPINYSDPLHHQYLGQQLPIFIGNDRRPTKNKVKWNKNTQKVYIFMAVALDPTESLCEYYTIFGVHLPELAEINSLITLLVFLLLIVLWIILFFCGYMIRKTRIRTLCIELERKRRLEEAAWKVVYQYERLLQENENIKLEEEFREFTENSEQAKGSTTKSKEKNKQKKAAKELKRRGKFSVIQL